MLKSNIFDSSSYIIPNKAKKNKPIRNLDNEHYDQFKGKIEQDVLEDKNGTKKQDDAPKVIFNNFQQENNRNQQIYQHIKLSNPRLKQNNNLKPDSRSKKTQLKEKKQRKQSQKMQNKATKMQTQQVKLEQGTVVKVQQQKSKGKKHDKKVNGTSNWQSFLSSSQNNKINTSKSSKSNHTQAVSLDCQFVKSGDQQILARISIVDESDQCLFDSFVKPSKKITDYVTQISGITYTHIKNAPDSKSVLERAKKILYNKIVVGHTVAKDISVCGLEKWKGWKALVDIADFPLYKQKNGRLISLKNLTLRHLGRSIQGQRHSSVEDAIATMDLYLLNHIQILKHSKII